MRGRGWQAPSAARERPAIMRFVAFALAGQSLLDRMGDPAGGPGEEEGRLARAEAQLASCKGAEQREARQVGADVARRADRRGQMPEVAIRRIIRLQQLEQDGGANLVLTAGALDEAGQGFAFLGTADDRFDRSFG